MGHAPPEKLVDARRSLLRPFLGPKSHYVLQFLENRISIVATRTLCEVVITDCAELRGHFQTIFKN